MGAEGDRQAIRGHYAAIASTYAHVECVRAAAYSQPLVDELPLQSAKRILDIGTGPGTMIEALRSKAASALIVGADLTPKMLEFARSRTRASVVAADAMMLPFRKESFDIVTYSFALFHLPSPPEALLAAARVLRGGGYLGVATYAVDGSQNRPRAIVDRLLEEFGVAPRGEWPEYAKEQTTQQEMAAMAHDAGFSVIRSWTAELRFEIDRSLSEILEYRAHRIESLTPEKAGEFRSRLSSELEKLSDEDFFSVHEVQYLVARL